MTVNEELRDAAQEADHAATDAERFAGTAIQYARDGNFRMFNRTIDTAISMAESLPHQLRSLRTFVQSHPELDRGEF